MSDRTIRRFWQLLQGKAIAWRRRHWIEKLWLGPAFLMLGFMRVILLVVPFRRLAPCLGRHMQAPIIVPLASQQAVSRAGYIGGAIRTAANYTPWESKCLAQAMVARVLLGLNRIPYALYLGVDKRNPSGMTAHAWVCVGPVAVTGGDSFEQFTVVSTFIAADIGAEYRK